MHKIIFFRTVSLSFVLLMLNACSGVTEEKITALGAGNAESEFQTFNKTKVTSSPVDQQTSVIISLQTISVVFDSEIDVNSLNAQSLTATPNIEYTVTSTNKQLTYRLLTTLSPNTVYDISIGNIKDIEGRLIEAYEWRFTTGGDSTVNIPDAPVAITPETPVVDVPVAITPEAPVVDVPAAITPDTPIADVPVAIVPDSPIGDIHDNPVVEVPVDNNPVIPVVDTTAPTTPGNITSLVDFSSVQLQWALSSDDVAVTGYRLMRDGVTLQTLTGTSFVDTTVVSGTSYQYSIIAFDEAGNESNSNMLSVKTLVDASGIATLDWLPPTKNIDASTLTDLKGYKIYYGLSSSSLDKSIVVDKGLTSFTIENLSLNKTYYFSIITINDVDIQSDLSEIVTLYVTG